MLDYDEPALVVTLAELETNCLVAFATAAATRLLPVYEYFVVGVDKTGKLRLRTIATQLWTVLDAQTVDAERWSATLDEVMRMLPEVSGLSLADDAVASLAYAIRCLLNRSPQEAAWSARRAYEAADQAAIWDLNVQTGLPETEAVLRAHRFVQRELAHQALDLQLLRSGLISEVKVRAFQNLLLTKAELASL